MHHCSDLVFTGRDTTTDTTEHDTKHADTEELTELSESGELCNYGVNCLPITRD